MKILTFLSTRPDIIRLSKIIKKLDFYLNDNKISPKSKHTTVYTNQNNNYLLKDVFLDELNIRKFDYELNNINNTSFAKQFSSMLPQFEEILIKEKPNRILVLGDVNGALLSIVAERMGIPVYHLEAGNRSNDKRMPEEINRRIIDTVSSFNLCYSYRARENLIREGKDLKEIFVVGNPLYEVCHDILTDYLHNTKKQNEEILIMKKYSFSNDKKNILVTFHRSENIDNIYILDEILQSLISLSEDYQINLFLHPRSYEKVQRRFNFDKYIDVIKLNKSVGFKEFTLLQLNSDLVLSDSGSIAEETHFNRTPCVILRDSSERDEIIQTGSCVLSSINSNKIVESVDYMIKRKESGDFNYTNNLEHMDINCSNKVINILLNHNYTQINRNIDSIN